LADKNNHEETKTTKKDDKTKEKSLFVVFVSSWLCQSFASDLGAGGWRALDDAPAPFLSRVLHLFPRVFYSFPHHSILFTF
jgi:hypothetical protein